LRHLPTAETGRSRSCYDIRGQCGEFDGIQIAHGYRREWQAGVVELHTDCMHVLINQP